MNLKGRRKLVVDGRTYFWDFREKGGKPGRGGFPDWPPRPEPVVRIVSEDKRFRATYDGVHLSTDAGRCEVRPHRFSPITPRDIERLIELAHRLPLPESKGPGWNPAK